MVLQAASPSDMQQWMTAIANGISAQLDVLPESTGTRLEKVVMQALRSVKEGGAGHAAERISSGGKFSMR